MHKVGDEVLVRAKVVDIDTMAASKYKYNVQFEDASFEETDWVTENVVSDKTYEQGLADAWELAKKIYDMKCDLIEEIFGVEGGFYDVIRNFTFEDCRDKIEAYEKEKEIKVGDVVECDGHKGVVVKAFQSGGVNIVHEDGVISVSCPARKCKKTGKHLEVADLLRQIGE